MPHTFVVSSRKDARKNLATLLAAYTPLTDLLSQDGGVYDHPAKGFDSKWPVICLMSGGSERPNFTMKGTRGRFAIMALVWVLYDNEATGEEAWTPAKAEDRLDDIEQAIAEFVQDEAHRNTQYWKHLMYERKSETFSSTLERGGLEYRVETFFFIFEEVK